MAEWPWRYMSRSKVIMRDTLSHASNRLCLIWKESIQSGHGMWDGRADGVKPIYPPATTSLYNDKYMHQWIESSLVLLMACCLFSTKSLSKPMLTQPNSAEILFKFRKILLQKITMVAVVVICRFLSSSWYAWMVAKSHRYLQDHFIEWKYVSFMDTVFNWTLCHGYLFTNGHSLFKKWRVGDRPFRKHWHAKYVAYLFTELQLIALHMF